MVFVTRALLVAKKQLTEMVRQPRNLAIVVGLPLAFMLIFGLAFGQSGGNTTYALRVQDQDGGALAQAYVKGLENLTYDDGTPMLSVRKVTDAAGVEAVQRDLEKRDAEAFLVIPQGFTEGLTPTQQPGQTPLQPTQTVPPQGTSVRVSGDPSYGGYNAAASIVEAYTQAFAAEAAGQAPPIEVQREAVTSTVLSGFDYVAPGLMVFAILMLAPQGAAILTREVETGTIDRLKQSPAGALSILGGVALAQLVLASVSLALMLVGARVMGFHNQGSWLAAYVIALFTALSAIGVGMLIASLAKMQQEAANVGTLFTVPASFLSGAFFPIPSVDLFTVNGRAIGIYHVLPTRWAVEAIRDVLTFGRTLQDEAFALTGLVVLSALYLLVGALLYRRFRLAPA